MTVKKTRIESEDQIKFDLIKEGKLKESSKEGYVSNKALFAECERYYNMKQKAIAEGKPIPPLTNKQGEAIIQIANRRCNSRMYVGYTNNWKEEMISNAIATAAVRCHGFDPNKSQNPFAYYTTVIDNAIREQLKAEKRELYIRYKSIEEARGFYGSFDDNMDESDIQTFNEMNDQDVHRSEFISQYEERNLNKKPKDKLVEDNSLQNFIKD